jgi:hypothetical protein
MGPLKPASKGTQEAYDPQSMTMKHDSVFSELMPCIADSGNLDYKWTVEGDHSNSTEPPSELRGE